MDTSIKKAPAATEALEKTLQADLTQNFDLVQLTHQGPHPGIKADAVMIEILDLLPQCANITNEHGPIGTPCKRCAGCGEPCRPGDPD